MKLILIRHGQSTYNQQNIFTGWIDAPLSEQGITEAQAAGKKLQAHQLECDIAFTSLLTRAIKTCNIVLEESNQLWIPQIKCWRLNERHYGKLQGLNKQQTAEQYGTEQVHTWRRNYNTLPPLLTPDSEHAAHRQRRYADLPPDSIPCGESLQTTLQRVLPCWQDQIAPAILSGKRVLVVAHGNSLRALIKHIEHISDSDIIKLEIPTGQPIAYQFDGKLNPIDKLHL